MAQGLRLGRYELEESLGAGGMGEVWRARHPYLDRPAAVKLIRPGVTGPARQRMLQRFQREARATSVLRSQHTVQVYDFGVTPDGAFYYVMELLNGVDLKSLVQDHGPVEAARAVHFGRAVCASLAEAHQRALLHRDIKPANIFACRLGVDFDFAKVLDFGLVKALSDDATPDAQLTASDALVGTPAFMAPELATSAPVDARSDLYALGCVLYWLVTGRLVFEAETTPMEMFLAHMNRPPTPPSERTELPIPGELEDVILRCLAKDPDERYPSATVLSRALAQVPLEPWDNDRAYRWWRSHLPRLAGEFSVARMEDASNPSGDLATPASELSMSLEGPTPDDRSVGATPRLLVLVLVLVLVVTAAAAAASFQRRPSPAAAELPEVPVAESAAPAEPDPPPQPEAAEPQPEAVAEPEPEPEPPPAPEPEPVASVAPAPAPPVPTVAEPAPEPEPEPEPEPVVAPAPVPVPDPEPLALIPQGDPPWLADIQIGVELPRGDRGGATRRPYMCLPTSTTRSVCRGYYTSFHGDWMPRSGTWKRTIETCAGRVAKTVELTKRWDPNAKPDQDDEVVSSEDPALDAGAMAARIVAQYRDQGFAVTRAEQGTASAAPWEVTVLVDPFATLEVRTEPDGKGYALTARMVGAAFLCND